MIIDGYYKITLYDTTYEGGSKIHEICISKCISKEEEDNFLMEDVILIFGDVNDFSKSYQWEYESANEFDTHVYLGTEFDEITHPEYFL